MSDDKKIGLIGKVKNYFKDFKIDFKKIVWPKQKSVFKNTGIVLAMIFIVGVFVAAIDAGLLQLLGMVMSVSTSK